MSRKKGDVGEEKAIKFLQNKGFRIVERNFYSRFGEIDIIALKDNILHFIEVKSGKGEPIYKITSSKLSKIQKTIEFFLNKTKLDFDFCIDAIIVKDNKIEIFENIGF